MPILFRLVNLLLLVLGSVLKSYDTLFFCRSFPDLMWSYISDHAFLTPCSWYCILSSCRPSNMSLSVCSLWIGKMGNSGKEAKVLCVGSHYFSTLFYGRKNKWHLLCQFLPFLRVHLLKFVLLKCGRLFQLDAVLPWATRL